MVLEGIENTEKLETLTKKVIDRLVCAGKVHIPRNHIFSGKGLEADLDKITAIQLLKTPKNKQQLQRLQGMVAYLSKFLISL